MKHALKQFANFTSKPFPLTFRLRGGGEVTVHFIVRPLLFVGDHPEVQLLSGFYQSAQAGCPCNRCLISSKDIWSTSKCDELRNHTTISCMRWIANHDESVEMRTKATKWLKKASVTGDFPGMVAAPDEEGTVGEGCSWFD